jgi:hypothetical protein
MDGGETGITLKATRFFIRILITILFLFISPLFIREFSAFTIRYVWPIIMTGLGRRDDQEYSLRPGISSPRHQIIRPVTFAPGSEERR